MCGRGKLTIPFRELAALYRAEPTPDAADRIVPTYNLAPTQAQAVVAVQGGRRRLTALRWGLIPSWAKDQSFAARAINARCEDAATKPSFAEALRKRRCLVLMDGFYEWQATPTGKQPYLFELPCAQPLPIAGLWERWVSKDGEVIESCAVLTRASFGAVALVHERMPVLIAAEDEELWLDPAVTNPLQISQLFHSSLSNSLVARRVSRRVNSPRNNDPALLLAE